MAMALRIGRVTQEKQHAGVTELPKPLHVGRKAVRGRRVELEVARVDDAADRRFNRERDRVRDRVADSDCLDPKRAELHRFSHPSAHMLMPTSPRPPRGRYRSFEVTKDAAVRTPAWEQQQAQEVEVGRAAGPDIASADRNRARGPPPATRYAAPLRDGRAARRRAHHA